MLSAFAIDDPDFQDNVSKPGLRAVMKNYGRFVEILTQRFAARTNAEIDELAATHELPLGVVVDIDEFQDHPQIKHMGSLLEHEVGIPSTRRHDSFRTPC